MRKLLLKKYRYENCLYWLFLLICLISSSLIIANNQFKEISILHPLVFGVPVLVISILALVLFIIKVVIKKPVLATIWKYCFYFIGLLAFIIVFDVVILGIVRSFVFASNLEVRPNTQQYTLLIRLAYTFMDRFKDIMSGVFTTLWLSLCGTIIGLILGFLFVTLRTLQVSEKDNEFSAFLKKIASGFVKIYVTIFRGTPMMVQAMIIYYFLPSVLAGIFNVDQMVINNILSVPVAGLITVSLNTTAYLTEVLRGGIESLDKGQMEAARSLGMTRTQSMIHVILPQGFKNALPAICNEFIINIKDTSVLSVISVMDLYFVISTINGKYANQEAIFICATIYLVLTYSISKLLGLLERKMNLVSKPLPSSN